MLRHHGSRQTYRHERVGWNSRLDELQAAVLRVKFRHLERFNLARRRVAARYRKDLAGTPVILPAESGRGVHAYHQFTIRSERRDAVREGLAARGIASSVFYPMPLHKQPAYEKSNPGLSLPASEEAARTVLSLPIHPLLGDAAVGRVCEAIRACC
jgi:dTDP-4-amino-4,6-dideoxygalactose transaminase